MADTTTELEVLDEIVDVLGGQSGQHETVVPVLKDIRDLLGGGGGGGGYNPSLSVGRADALTGSDSTAQWTHRESTGSGSATVRSVKGAAVAWNQLVGSDTSSVTVPSGHKYLGIIGGTSAIATSDGTAVSVTGGTDQLFDLTAMFGSGNEPTTVAEFERMYPEPYYPYSAPTLKPVQIAGIASTDAQGGELDGVEWTAQTLRAAGSVADMLYNDHVDVKVGATTIDPTADGVEFGYSADPNAAGLYSHYLTYTAEAWEATGLGRGSYNTSSYLLDVASPLGASNPTGFATATSAGIAVMSFTKRVYLRWPSLLTEQQFAALIATGGNSTFFYQLATTETTTFSPALPMTYKVQAGGSESIIVPDGEISAAPLITLAEGESAAELVMDALACIAAPDGPTATANHSVGTYLTMQGKLYKVTSAIAVGETIVAGTNVSQTTVMAELIALTQ